MNKTNIVGANPKNGRREKDFYPTPPEVTEALLRFLELPKEFTIWEPACGHGDMIKVMEDHGYKVFGTDIMYGFDFISCDPVKCDFIITNPPFSLAEEFIRRAKSLGVPFAFLLKSQYWHAKRRFRLFQEITPTFVLPLTWRPDFTGQGSSLLDMCWVVWCGEKHYHECMYCPLQRPNMELRSMEDER